MKELERVVGMDSAVLRISRVGGRYELSCLWVEEDRLRRHVWGMCSIRDGWPKELFGHLATVLSCVTASFQPKTLSFECDESDVQSVAGAFDDHVPALVPNLGEDWLLQLIRNESQRCFHGLEPIGVLRFLRVRLECELGGSLMVKLP